MRLYHGAHKCGHQFTIPLVGGETAPATELVAEHENRVCSHCFRRDYIERKRAASAAAKAQKLPAFTTGTPKQRKFANVIRTEAQRALFPVHWESYQRVYGTDAIKWIDGRSQITRRIARTAYVRAHHADLSVFEQARLAFIASKVDGSDADAIVAAQRHIAESPSQPDH